MGSQENASRKLAAVLRETDTHLFEYQPHSNVFTEFDINLHPLRTIPEFLSRLSTSNNIDEADRWKISAFFMGTLQGPIDINVIDLQNKRRKVRFGILTKPSSHDPEVLEGYARDVTEEKLREEELERNAKLDPLTKLYNQTAGKEAISAYLASKNPYAACGLLIIDIDFFKNANDNFGHQFGDQVLVSFARLLSMMFRPDDVIIRMGGDEFAAFLKDIDHASLMKKARQLVETVRNLTFSQSDYSITCSVGVCFLPQNVSGYTFDHLFKNADWALYRAKEGGRNRYEFCDYLQRFELSEDTQQTHLDIDTRYLHGDIVSSAFEIFEKMGSFNEAIKLLMEVIGIRFQLDRITIVQTDIKQQSTSRQYQWVSERAPEVLETSAGFTKKDFLTLFNSYDENDTTVLHHDDMDAYSDEATTLLMQGEAKTVLYAAMYCEGRYTGAVSYVTCGAKRFWSKQDRARLGELTKIISAHLAKNRALNASTHGTGILPEYDSLTGLLSFNHFREEVERVIVGGFATQHAMIYIDFQSFNLINKEYGFSSGDLLLKEYSGRLVEELDLQGDSFLSRVVGDCFVLFMPYDDLSSLIEDIKRFNNSFIKEWGEHFPKLTLRIRTGIYVIEPNCPGASAAVDAANFARTQLADDDTSCIKLYDDKIASKRHRELGISDQMDTAFEHDQIQVYLQPRVSLTDRTVTGAEALVRWKQEDGSILLPNEFLPIYERNGKVIDLDMYVFDQVAAFLARNDARGNHPLFISVNASILHASEGSSADRYKLILEKHGIDPDRVQIELAESDVITSSGDARQLFNRLQDRGIQTAWDDFGASNSTLATLADAPVNTIKLDRSFVKLCAESIHGTELLRRTIDLIKGLGFRVTCEGVETEEEVEILRKAGCDEAQGFLFSRPLPLETFEQIACEGFTFTSPNTTEGELPRGSV